MNARYPDNKIETCIILKLCEICEIPILKKIKAELKMLFKKNPKMGVITILFVNSLL